MSDERERMHGCGNGSDTHALVVLGGMGQQLADEDGNLVIKGVVGAGEVGQRHQQRKQRAGMMHRQIVHEIEHTLNLEQRCRAVMETKNENITRKGSYDNGKSKEKIP